MSLAKFAQKEIRIIFSTANAFHRQAYAGTIQLLNEAIAQRGIKVRILTPKDDLIEEKGQQLMQQQIDIRYIEPPLQTKVSIIVADDNSSLSVELKDDTKGTSYEVTGLVPILIANQLSYHISQSSRVYGSKQTYTKS